MYVKLDITTKLDTGRGNHNKETKRIIKMSNIIKAGLWLASVPQRLGIHSGAT